MRVTDGEQRMLENLLLAAERKAIPVIEAIDRAPLRCFQQLVVFLNMCWVIAYVGILFVPDYGTWEMELWYLALVALQFTVPPLSIVALLYRSSRGANAAAPSPSRVSPSAMRLTAAALKQRFAELRDLINEWDPIGLIDEGAPEDEYDCLVGPVLRHLEARTPVHEIAAFLDREMAEHFGASGATGSVAFAAKAQAWYTECWPDSEPTPLPDPEAGKRG